MKNQFPFQIIDGFRRGSAADKSSFSSGVASSENQLLQQLVGRATEADLPLILEASQKRLTALLEDRNRIGRDLHDCVLQPLFGITLSLETHRLTCTNLHSEINCSCEQSVKQLNKLIEKIRRIIRGLEEGAVQEFDLLSEMNSLISTYEPLGQLQIELIVQSQALNLLTQEEKRELFNITREALNNCIRHAQATRATIKLNHSNDKIRLAIVDNGIGFSPSENQSRGYGLPNMETRAKKLGGQLHVRSERGRGTRIIAEFALEPSLCST